MRAIGQVVAVATFLGLVACGSDTHPGGDASAPTVEQPSPGGPAHNEPPSEIHRKYQVVDIGTPPGSTWANATAISPNGKYVAGAAGPAQSFLWDGTAIRDLGIPFSSATGVNDSGVVVGEVMISVRETRGFRWKDDAWVALGTLGDPMLSSAAAVNGAGMTVGWATGPDGLHAVAWTPSGDIHDLAPSTYYSNAYGIAENGIVVGANYVRDPSYRDAVRFGDGTVNDLAGGHDAAAFAVNSAGTAVGSAWFGGDEHGVIYADGEAVDVGSLPGMRRTRLLAVNEQGIAVGSAYDSGAWPYSSRGVIYADGRLLDLNALVDDPDWLIVAARGIANDGSIAAWGVRISSLTPGSAIVLRPVTQD